MCGIFISNHPDITTNSEKIISQGLDFRGPDGSSGLIENGEWKSYHSRLTIIDVSDGTNQPVLNDNGSQLIFNGEILNYKELGFKYLNKEYFSDTFLLNDLIKAKKLNLEELDGFFAFIFINSCGELEYACRDKFGVKPLFFIRDKETISFSSEPIVLKNLFNCQVNQSSIEEYYAFRAPIFQGSYFMKIDQVNPGSCLVNGEYFHLEDELMEKKSGANLSDLEEALIKSINSRKISDVPIGLLLSKGIDSNLIKEYGSFNKFYTVGSYGDEDLEYLSERNIENLTILEVDNKSFKDAFDKLLRLRGEPLSVPNEVMLYLIALKARKDGVKVLLSGEGADEFFAGYDRIFNWAKTCTEFNVDTFIDLYSYIRPKKESKIYNDIETIFNKCRLSEPFEKVRWFFIKYHMPVLFRRLDFSLMAAGVEGREPLANDHLFQICKLISGEDLMINELGKKPLRELISKYLGKDFAYEKKVGFPVDLTKIYNEFNLSSYEIWFQKNLEILK